VAAPAADSGAEPSRLRSVIDALIGEALKDVLRNLRDQTDLQRRIVRGELDRSAVNRAYIAYARREGSKYRRKVAELTATYYADLIEVGNRYSAEFYEEVLPRGDPPAPTVEVSTGGGSASRVPMELHGEPGKEVVARFALENTDPEPVEVAFEVGVCHGPEGEEFTAPLSVHPARVTVPAGGQEEITIRVAMLPSVFAPGQLYRTVVRVAGYRQLELDLVIWAEEPMVVFPDDLTALAKSPADVPAEPTADGFKVRCGTCGRDFARNEPSTRLYPHKTPDGAPCPERLGQVVVPESG
jgi:hypothetical protein